MPQSIKFLAIIFSILLVTITPNSFATEKEEALITFSGKGKISESSHFPGLVVWSHINGEMGTFLIQTEEKLVSVRTQLSPSTNCEQDHTSLCFDGIEQTLKAEVSAVIDESMPQYVINVIFDTRHGGYGDRTGQIVTEAITPHLATVIVSEGKVISVIIDGTWDEINQKLL